MLDIVLDIERMRADSARLHSNVQVQGMEGLTCPVPELR